MWNHSVRTLSSYSLGHLSLASVLSVLRFWDSNSAFSRPSLSLSSPKLLNSFRPWLCAASWIISSHLFSSSTILSNSLEYFAELIAFFLQALYSRYYDDLAFLGSYIILMIFCLDISPWVMADANLWKLWRTTLAFLLSREELHIIWQGQCYSGTALVISVTARASTEFLRIEGQFTN